MGFISSRRSRMSAAFNAWQTKITNEKQAIEDARLQALEDEAVSKSTSYLSDINSAKDSIETSVSSITSKLASITGYSTALHGSSTSAEALTQYNHMVSATKDLSDLFTTLIQQKALLDTAKDGLEKSKGSYSSTTTIYNNGVTAYNTAVTSFNIVKSSAADADEMIADGSAAMSSMKADEAKTEALAAAEQNLADFVGSAPATLDTLNELAAALGDDPNFSTTVSNQIGTKLNTSAYTASDVLSKIKTVDGSGSGLDADTVDGLHASSFAPVSHSHDYVPERGGSDWNDNTVINDVIGQMGWKNYGNGHTIFDASASTSPNGTAINNTNPDVSWSATYPTLMGWNGVSTYGVRVDRAKYAEDADTVDGLQSSQFLRSDVVDSVFGLTTGSGSSWISQKDATDVAIQESNTGANGSTYRAFVRSKNSQYTYTLGRLANSTFGFYGYLNTTTANNTDFSCAMNNSGDWTVTGTLIETSDARLKENVETLKNPLDKILSLRGVSYNKIDSPDKPEIGFIAQEVEEVVPEIVTTDDTKEGMKAVSYARTVALLVEAMKEQQQQIDELKRKLGEA